MTTATALYSSTPITPLGTEKVAGDRAADGVTGGMLTQAIADLFKGTKGTDIASATTTDIGAATGMFVHITGTTTITGLGTAAAGVMRLVTFDGILTLTHNGTALILPTGANITTAAGDSALFVSEGSGNWRCLGYWRKSGSPLVSAGLSIQTVTSSATVTPAATNDKVIISAQAAGLTIANPSGTPTEGQGFVVALKDNGTARSIAFGADYRAMGADLPTTTVLGKWIYIPVMYNATDSKWDVFTASRQA